MQSQSQFKIGDIVKYKNVFLEGNHNLLKCSYFVIVAFDQFNDHKVFAYPLLNYSNLPEMPLTTWNIEEVTVEELLNLRLNIDHLISQKIENNVKI